MLNAISPWRHAGHLVEAPTEVALVGESSCDGDVNERKSSASLGLRERLRPVPRHSTSCPQLGCQAVCDMYLSPPRCALGFREFSSELLHRAARAHVALGDR